MERARSLPGGASKVMCSSLELTQALTLNTRPSCMIALAPSNDNMFKMEDGSFSGPGLLKRLPWPMLLLEVMLVSIVCATASGCAGVHDVCCRLRVC